MLYPQTTAARKRIALREMLASGTVRQFPGAYTPISAKLIQEKGYDGVYISGAVLANELGFPDIGLTTLSEVATRAGQIARMTDLPAIVDADTGFGEPMNVARTVQELEDAGLAGCHIEDQVNPKRCGHLENKNVVAEQTALQRIAAAAQARRDENFLIMARTDLRGVEGLEAAIARMRRLVEAGADAIFPEAMRDLGEFEAMRSALDVPILAKPGDGHGSGREPGQHGEADVWTYGADGKEGGEGETKADALDDPMVSEEHITAFGWASPQEIDDIMALAIRVNDFLTGLFLGVGIQLVDFKIETGRLFEGDMMRIIVADEISPDSCRLWDVQTQDKLDKDRFRRDMGGLVEAYQEVARRLGPGSATRARRRRRPSAHCPRRAGSRTADRHGRRSATPTDGSPRPSDGRRGSGARRRRPRSPRSWWRSAGRRSRQQS